MSEKNANPAKEPAASAIASREVKRGLAAAERLYRQQLQEVFG